jgi:hypothetical protein
LNRPLRAPNSNFILEPFIFLYRKHLIFAESILTKSITPKSFQSKVRPSSSFQIRTPTIEEKSQPVATETNKGSSDEQNKKPRYNPIRKCFSAIGISSSEPNFRTGPPVIRNSFKDKNAESYDYELKKEQIKKMSSVIEFNKFKNKFCGQILLRPIEPIGGPNIRLIRPLTENRKYIENLQSKRQNHIKFLNKRQMFLAHSLNIKKL